MAQSAPAGPKINTESRQACNVPGSGRLRERGDTAVTARRIHNRLWDCDTGNHLGHGLACWQRDCKEQVFLFTRDLPWTGRTTSPGAERRPPSATRPSPATGV